MEKRYFIKIILVLSFGLLLGTHLGFSQQETLYTHYMFNPAVMNPGYVASVDQLQFFGLYRAQWIGLKGAPKTAYLSAVTPLNESGLGLGLHMKNEQIGVMNQNDFSVDLAYKIDLNYNYKLAVGLKGTASLLDIDYDKLQIYDGSDPISSSNVKGEFLGNVGAGIYLYSDKGYVGLSVPMIFSSDCYNENDYRVMTQKSHFYVMGGYVFDLNSNIQFKPAALIKTVIGGNTQLDITTNFLLYEKFSLGMAYRLNAAVSGLVSFQIMKELLIGYSYEVTTNKLLNYNSGTHEIFMKFELFNKQRKIVAPRFF